MEYRVFEVDTDKNDCVQNAKCTLDNGFEYSVISFHKSRMLVVVDYRLDKTEPVGIITNLPLITLEQVEGIVLKIIHLYKTHQIISITSTLDEFYSTFSKVA